MSYIGRNPKVRSITCEGFADFTAADESAKREGRLVYVQDEDKLYIDNGAGLSKILDGASHSGLVLTGASIEDPVRLDVKKGTTTELSNYLLTAPSNGQIVFDETLKEMFQIVDGAYVPLGGGGGGGIAGYWQKELSATLTSDGVIGDLTVTGITIGNKIKITVNAKCVRQATAVSEVQSLSFDNVPTHGRWRINFDGQITEYLGYDASALEVENALLALSNIGAGDVSVSGDFATDFVVTFQNGLANTDVAEMIIQDSDLSFGGTGGTNEVQDLTFSATPTGGSFTITFDGETTAAIPYNASNAQVQAALEALPNINGVTVVGI